MTISFFVPGLPKPAGSKRAFFNKGMKFPIVVDANPNAKDWKADVKAFAKAMAPEKLLTGPLRVTMHFTMPRPKGHFGSGTKADILKSSAPRWHTSKPDALKLARGVEDSCTSVIYTDDSLIAEEHLTKVYGEKPGVLVMIEELELADTSDKSTDLLSAPILH